MKHYISISIVLLSLNLLGQDIINLKDGNELYTKILKISDSEIEYKKFSNLDGPTYIKKTIEIESIKYQNGSTEIFTSKQVYDFSEDKSKKESLSAEDKTLIVLPPAYDSIGIANVNQLNGIDVYFMSKPLLKYKIVFSTGDLMSDIDLKSIFWGGLARAHVDEKMQKIVNAAYRKSENESMPIHAILYSGGNRAVAIQYVENELPTNRLAKVDKINGVDVYVLAEPYNKKYEIITTAAAKAGGLTSMMSYGIIASTMDKDIENLVERLHVKKNKADAVIYLEGKKGNAIRFK